MNLRALRTPIASVGNRGARPARSPGQSNAERGRELPGLILKELATSGSLTIPELRDKWGYRGTSVLLRHFRELLEQGAIARTGEARARASVYEAAQ